MPEATSGPEAGAPLGQLPRPSQQLAWGNCLGEGVEGLVSVIIPTYNRSGLLLEALASVAQQDHRPLEIIVVDDGSTDGTPQAVAAWTDANAAKAGLEVRLVVQPNAGAPAARNRGVLESRGALLQFLDSDDQLTPNKIRLQVEALSRNEIADFAYSPVREMENPARIIYCQTEMSPRRMVLKQIVVPAFQTASPLIRRSAMQRLGRWDEEIAPMEDWELFSRAALMGLSGAYVPEAAVLHRMDVPDRLRFGGQPERVEQYARGRFAHLESMWAEAGSEWKSDQEFRSAMAWQLMRVAAAMVLIGWDGDDVQKYRQSERLATGPARLWLKLVMVARAGGLRSTAAHAVNLVTWVLQRMEARLGMRACLGTWVTDGR